MSYLTADEVRAVRLHGSKLVPIAGTTRSIRVINMSGSSAGEIPEIQAAIAAGTKKQPDLFLFMLQASCATEAGDLLSAAEAKELYDCLPLDEVLEIINSVNAKLAAKVTPGNSVASTPAA